MRESAFGRDHADLAGPLTNAARMRLALGDPAGAQRDIGRALTLAEKAYAPDYIGRGHVALAAAEIAAAEAIRPPRGVRRRRPGGVRTCRRCRSRLDRPGPGDHRRPIAGR
ncbi:MAG: hypothetical protein R3F18_11805 [Lysobacterales bacterium]